ncbi:MAG: response regulator [Eudoraea sp.]|nr:response regulator [Eudoraea sp.]NNJ40340.1 response regulator [Eudoraea sp.]
MRSFSALWKPLNTRLEQYVKVAGDNPDTVLQKKIWWLLNIASAPILALSIVLMGTVLGKAVLVFNILFLLSMILPLVVFHFHRRNITAYALFSQLAIVVLTSIKVYLMGGMVNVGTPVYVGLIGPIYALILPNKKRAVSLFLLYTATMIIATLANPLESEPYVFYRYFMGFLISNSAIFFTLYYFTSQWEKTKEAEKTRLKEINTFKTRFYTHIAHEFRTPLSIITGIADQIKADPSRWLNPGHEMIKRNTENLISLTNQLLDLAKLEDKSMPLNLVQDDLVLYTRYLVESFHSVAELKKIKLRFSTAVEELIMDMDPDKLRDILSNLLSNALKFTPEGGSVTVNLQDINETGNPFVKLEVKDTGIGIPVEEQPFIFDRYFQANNHLESQRSGSGLGLALTRELVRLLGGEIGVSSTPGKGSMFEVKLPVSNDAQPISLPTLNGVQTTPELTKKPHEQVKPKEAETKALNLLLVEDNADVIRYLQSLLEGEYHIEIACNGTEGLQKALSVIPDLIISDVMMPEMDGFTLSRKLKADLRTSHIPIVLLTARSDFDSRMEGLKSGADAYLSKPFNRQELFVRINALIGLRKDLQARYALLADRKNFHEQARNGKHLREDAFMEKVQELLMAHLSDEEFGIAQLCEVLGMSRSQLYRKFAALTDMSVYQFIITLRLEKAKELLATTHLNVSEVAYDTGFKNPAHFSRAFSEKFGYAPSQLKSAHPTADH